MSLKEAFNNIPVCLKNIFMRRIVISVVSLVASVVGAIVAGVALFFPFFGVALFFLVAGIGMLYNCLLGEYVVVTGTCKNIELTTIRGSIKSIYIATEDGANVLKVLPKEGAKKLNIGDSVAIYIPSRAMTAQVDGVYMVQEYYCLELLPKQKAQK